MTYFSPKKMQLGAVYETVISDNSEIFRANGFEFEFYENGNYFYHYFLHFL